MNNEALVIKKPGKASCAIKALGSPCTGQWIAYFCLWLMLICTPVFGSTADSSPEQPVPVLTVEQAEAIREIFRERVDKYRKTVGIAAGVINERGSQVICYGHLSNDHSREVDGKTVFEIGSITKVFTGLLLAEMAQRGELSLDDPIAKFLPGSVKVPTKENKEITLLHLATHTSGLPRLPDNFNPADPQNPYADYSVEDMYEFLSGCDLSREAGAQVEYSNYGAGLLGQILTLQAGKDYETLVVERICAPLGMSSTRIKLIPELQKRLALGHDMAGEVVKNWDFQALAGCGALRSTVNDMLTFLAANLGLSETGLWPAMQETHLVRYKKDETDKKGLAWLRREEFGTEYIWHNGGTGGYRSFIGFVKDERRAVVVLSNSSHSVDDIGRHLLDSRFELAELELPRTEITLETDVLNAYVGKYEITPEVVFNITVENDKLMARLTGQPSVQIFPESETEFFYKIVDARITFYKNEKGEVTHLVTHQNGQDVTAVKQGAYYTPSWVREEVPVECSVLESYTGRYELAPGAEFTVTLDDGKLMVRFTGQSPVQVFPESETGFFYKAVDAQITFENNAEGKVTGLVLHQGGENHRARKVE